jgi:hypothetical protein
MSLSTARKTLNIQPSADTTSSSPLPPAIKRLELSIRFLKNHDLNVSFNIKEGLAYEESVGGSISAESILNDNHQLASYMAGFPGDDHLHTARAGFEATLTYGDNGRLESVVVNTRGTAIQSLTIRSDRDAAYHTVSKKWWRRNFVFDVDAESGGLLYLRLPTLA